jgi:hypothetical protein
MRGKVRHLMGHLLQEPIELPGALCLREPRTAKPERPSLGGLDRPALVTIGGGSSRRCFTPSSRLIQTHVAPQDTTQPHRRPSLIDPASSTPPRPSLIDPASSTPPPAFGAQAALPRPRMLRTPSAEAAFSPAANVAAVSTWKVIRVGQRAVPPVGADERVGAAGDCRRLVLLPERRVDDRRRRTRLREPHQARRHPGQQRKTPAPQARRRHLRPTSNSSSQHLAPTGDALSPRRPTLAARPA